MGHLEKLVLGGKANLRHFVTTPFPNDQDLQQELVDFWNKVRRADPDDGTGLFTVRKHVVLDPDLNDSGFKDIQEPAKSVLYIIAHSGEGINFIGGGNERKSPADLADWLTERKHPLPFAMLAIKVWACFSGCNGFAQSLSNIMAQRGFNRLIVVGYNAATGGPFDLDDDEQKHVWTVNAHGKRDQVISRASQSQAIFWGDGTRSK